MADKGDVICLIPVQNGEEEGAVVALYPENTQPFGLNFKDSLRQITASTTTTKTVSVTLGPDVDTDPEDSDT